MKFKLRVVYIMMHKSILTAITLSLFLSSCGAYYNTFYNTKKLYKEAIREREKRQGDQPTPAEKKKYDETIEKASKILEIYPDSKYVDDALFILGECMYYKGDFIKAHRKFQELITYFPDGNYYLRAKLWLARTNIELGDYASAQIGLKELLKMSKLKRDLRDESRYLLGEIHFKQKNYQVAEDEFRVSAGEAKEEKIKAHSYFQLGRCEILNGKPQNAVGSFAKAIKHSSDIQFEFGAQLNYARALKLAGDFKTAMRVCNELLEDESVKNKHGAVQLEIADIIYQEGKALNKKLSGTNLEYKGKVEEALENYGAVVLQKKRTETSATAFFRMGKIYETDLLDYARAKENYQRVRTEYARSEYAEEAERRAKNIGDLIRLSNLVRKEQGEQLLAEAGGGSLLSSLELLLMEHGVDPELRFMEQRKKLAQLEKELQLIEGNAPTPQEDARSKEVDQLVTTKLQLAETYLFQFGQIDSALHEYDEIIELFPEHPDAAKALYSSAFVYENEFHNKFKTDSLLYTLIQRFPDSAQARDAKRKLGLPVGEGDEPAAELFRQAERSLFTHQNIPGALQQYRMVASTYPKSDYAPKALFVLGWIQEELIYDNGKARKVYEELVDRYPESPYAIKSNKKLLASKVKEPVVPAIESRDPESATAATTELLEDSRKLLEQEELAAPEPDTKRDPQLHDDEDAPERNANPQP